MTVKGCQFRWGCLRRSGFDGVLVCVKCDVDDDAMFGDDDESVDMMTDDESECGVLVLLFCATC